MVHVPSMLSVRNALRRGEIHLVVCPYGKVEVEEERNLLIQNYGDRGATILQFTKTVDKQVNQEDERYQKPLREANKIRSTLNTPVHVQVGNRAKLKQLIVFLK